MNNLIEEYNNSGRIFMNELKEFYFTCSDLNEAIKRAALGQNHKNVMDEHQWHIGYTTAKIALEELMKYHRMLRSTKHFSELFKITEKVRAKTYGIGDLWSYDTALRIGFKLKIYPDKVYLQRGAREGARKLFNRKRILGRALDKSVFTENFQELEELQCYEIENFLCCYKSKF